MVETQYVLALRKSARRFGQAVMSTLIPPLVALTRTHLAERTDAKHKRRPEMKVFEEAQKEGIDTKGLTAEEVAALLKKLKHARAKADAAFSEPEIDKAAEVAAVRTVKHSKHEFKRLGIDVRQEPTMTPLMNGWRRDNVSLIKNMQQQQLDKIEAILSDGYGRRAESIAKDIENAVNVSESRAELIARDQVLKLHAKVTRYRQMSAKIKKYVWTTSNDERVRPEHEELEGETFSWDGEGDPEEGHPGDAVNCRCVAYPILDNDFL